MLKLLRVRVRNDGNATLDLTGIDRKAKYIVIATDSTGEILNMWVLDGKYLAIQKYMTLASFKRMVNLLRATGVDIKEIDPDAMIFNLRV